MHVHVFGASGSGTTTLGQALQTRLGLRHFDTDAFFWEPTEPPFTTPRTKSERDAIALRALSVPGDWVLSGSIVRWSPEVVSLVDCLVFLYVPPEVRMERLRVREAARYGERVELGGDMHDASQAFLSWAARYDAAGPEQRSLAGHEAWMHSLAVPVLELRGDLTVAERVAAVATFAKRSPRPQMG